MKYIVMIRDQSLSGYRRIGSADTMDKARKLSEPGSEIWTEKKYRQWQDEIIDNTFRI